ncbi:hypothetical protein [Azospirillum canadense]|uniref:hypothetical protein n=1 Tax=Azospirillum canadense TaxID=403962 RepID=UPI002227CF34|nr:hypothetical protein [Azospirillum canadense]MCW2238638.1 hypothetical protein [Azospirillum canadense]
MSSLSSGLNSLVATVLGSHPALRLLPISRYTQEQAAVYATANGRAIAHEVDEEGRQSLLVALEGLDYVSVCDLEHDLSPPGDRPLSLLIPELRSGLLARFAPKTAGDVCRIVEAVCPA